MTAVLASFADFKLVKTRQMAQFVFELPLEKADAALAALGGVPQPDKEVWVGIAPITEEAAQRAATPAPEDITITWPASRWPPTDKPKERQRWDTLPPTQQAGIRCNDVEFQAWLSASNADEAALSVRNRCGVKSRTELATDNVAAALWRQMDIDFQGRGIR